MTSQVDLTAEVERKDASLPRFVVVADSAIASWSLTGTTVVEIAIGGQAAGRRSLKRWSKKGDRWFIDLPESLCERHGIDTGDRIRLGLRPATEDQPRELRELLASSARARSTWGRLTASQQRMLQEHVFAAEQPATRRRRARRALLCES